MPWTEADEAEFQRSKQAWFAEQDRQDEELRIAASRGLSPKCPQCGSHRYVEATRGEFCEDCGAYQGY